jgi:predicted TIM-barrel fold metal-dependent hydrolase
MRTICRADCHAHIIAPTRFHYATGPGYKPRADVVGEVGVFRQVLAAHGISHALLVQPSCYGYDNACMLEAIAQSNGRFRGVAMVHPDATDAEMFVLKEQGIVGVRLHLMLVDPEALSRPGASRFLARVKALGWFIQVYAKGDVWAGALAPLRASRVKVVVDHFGEPDVARGVDQPGFQAILDLAQETDAVVKLSAVFRSSNQPFPHADVEPFIAATLDAFGVGRCLWGSDWPFINTTQQVAYGNLLGQLAHWVLDLDDQNRILWRNPAQLCGFTEGDGPRHKGESQC